MPLGILKTVKDRKSQIIQPLFAFSSHSNMVMGCWQRPGSSGKSGSSSTDCLDVDAALAAAASAANDAQNTSPARTVSPRTSTDNKVRRLVTTGTSWL